MKAYFIGYTRDSVSFPWLSVGKCEKKPNWQYWRNEHFAQYIYRKEHNWLMTSKNRKIACFWRIFQMINGRATCQKSSVINAQQIVLIVFVLRSIYWRILRPYPFIYHAAKFRLPSLKHMPLVKVYVTHVSNMFKIVVFDKFDLHLSILLFYLTIWVL